MANIGLAIKIPEDVYEFLTGKKEWLNIDLYSTLIQATQLGTLLPKEHGKIGDLDKLIRAMKERNDDNGGKPLNAVDRGYNLAFQHMIEESKECVIIEADKE